MTNISYLESEKEDQDEQDLDVENECQVDPYPHLATTPTQRPKWEKNIIEDDGNSVRYLDGRRRKRSQYYDENLALLHTDLLLSERCFMMMGSYPQCYREAWNDPRCQEAMYDEFDLLQNKKTWDLVTFPHRRKLVQQKWIYKTKYRI